MTDDWTAVVVPEEGRLLRQLRMAAGSGDDMDGDSGADDCSAAGWPRVGTFSSEMRWERTVVDPMMWSMCILADWSEVFGDVTSGLEVGLSGSGRGGGRAGYGRCCWDWYWNWLWD